MQEGDRIVIVNAGKRGGVVTIDVTDYIEKAERQLNNKKHRCMQVFLTPKVSKLSKHI